MTEQEFINIVKREIVKRFPDTQEDDWYTVWMVKVLQNNKALLSTDVFDGCYIEATYNGDDAQLYIDVYKHENNFVMFDVY